MLFKFTFCGNAGAADMPLKQAMIESETGATNASRTVACMHSPHDEHRVSVGVLRIKFWHLVLCFPRIAGPPVLSSGCWVHDGFHMLSGLSDAPTLTTQYRCQAAIEHRINIAHSVLHRIWNGELSSEK